MVDFQKGLGRNGWYELYRLWELRNVGLSFQIFVQWLESAGKILINPDTVVYLERERLYIA